MQKSTLRRVAKFFSSWIASSISGLHLFVQIFFGTGRVIHQRILHAPGYEGEWGLGGQFVFIYGVVVGATVVVVVVV